MANRVVEATELPQAPESPLDATYARAVLLMSRRHAARINDSVQVDGSERMTGLFYPAQYATGSLPTPSAAIEGGVAYDTTLQQLVYCNGTVWVAV